MSRDKLDVAIAGEASGFEVANTEAAARDLAVRLKQAGVGRVGLEATGGYERVVQRVLQDEGLDVVVLQPRRLPFATMRLQRAKSDRIDTRLIAACTQLLERCSRRVVDARFDALGDQLTFIEQAEADVVRCKTRLEHITDRRLRRGHVRQCGGISNCLEVAADHAAAVEICGGTASIVAGVSSAMASVCMYRC